MKIPPIVIALALAASGTAAHEITGKVTISGRADAKLKTIVYAERLDASPKPRAQRARLAQKDKSFTPRALAVPIGSTVEFPN